MGPIPDPILLEKFLGYSRESNMGSLGWQSDVLTTIPNSAYSKALQGFNLSTIAVCKGETSDNFSIGLNVDAALSHAVSMLDPRINKV